MQAILLRLLFGALAQFLLAVVRAFAQAHIDNTEFLSVTSQIVEGVEARHRNKPWRWKQREAAGAVRHYVTSLGKDPTDAVINTAIEIAVLQMREQER